MTKQIHNLIQGTAEWHQFRLSHHGASEAAAMLGVSPTTKRDELLQIKKTGLAKEFSDFVEQHIFAEGHRVEPLARELVEKEIADDLFPVVYSLDNLSASCDGITMDEAIAFECKQFNQELFDSVSAGIVPDYHMAQCQQIMMVTDATSVYFTVSDGTEENTVWTIVGTDQKWFDRIRDGWEQFDKDLESFILVEPVAELVAEAIPQLPALSVITRGEVVQSNLPQFKQVAIGFITSVNTDLQTDQDFVNAKAFVKFAQEGEDKLEAQKSAILAQTADIELAIRTIDDVKAELRAKRLEIDKLVKAREQAIKIEIKFGGESDWNKHKSELQASIKGVQLIVSEPDLAGAMKNKRTIDSLRNAVNTEVANAKIAASQVARDIKEKLAFMQDNASEYRFLFNDLQTIIYKPMDDLQLVVTTRIEQHKKSEAERLEQERQRIAAEEKAKLEAAEKAKQEALAAKPVATAETPEQLRERAKSIANSAEYADRNADRDRELAQAAALRKRADDLEKAQTAEVDNTVIVDIKQTFENVSITKTGDKSTVVIPTEDYDKMIARLDWLDCLEAAGVDSWDGYDTARQMFAEQQAA